ncbi:MAG: serine hydrolase [Flavobacterium sp.]|nr:serine hydrolase [Flavobacterium sp.]
MYKSLFLFSLVILFSRCAKSEDVALAVSSPITIIEEPMYFPPLAGNTWDTKTFASLRWKQAAVQPLLDFLALKNSRGFIILVNGRIVLENYFKNHTASANWYWASAGKTLTSTITGIAQQENFLSINNKVSDYIGTGWTSATLAQENKITCSNLLTMTSGLDDAFNDSTDTTLDDSVLPQYLKYKQDAGTRWAYDNVYVKLQDVVAQATGQSWSNYFDAKLKDKIGMNGFWDQSNNNSVFWSTTRSMARFGLLMLNKGKWDNNQILKESYYYEATNALQPINLGYGYLWWINGQPSFHLPGSQATFPGSIITTGPIDMFMALGKNDQKIYVVPSRKMVVIRMGDSADPINPTFAVSGFDSQLWLKISALYQ